MLFTVRNKNKMCDLPFKNEYDNIVPYESDIFILHKDGKMGLCQYKNEQKNMICACEYDLIDGFGDNLLLSNDKHICHYNLFTGILKKYKEVEIQNPYMYACDDEYQYIIDQSSGEIIHKRKYTEYDQSWYEFCGHTEKGPAFYDYRYCIYLYPSEGKYMYYEDSLIHPFIINNKNVINVTYGENGVGVTNPFGKSIIDNEYDEISVELKITAKKKNSSIEKTIPLLDKVYTKDTLSPLEEW